MSEELVQYSNCRLLRDHELIKEDLWVRGGRIINPEKVFYDEKVQAGSVIDCGGNIIAPGLIELQINGGYGYDFSRADDIEEAINKVAKELTSHGVTSFCPTIVTSPKEVYHKILPKIQRRKGDKNGATILGLHLEGPFISKDKKGAHPSEYITGLDEGISTLEEVYGNLENAQIITLAPEIGENTNEVIEELKKRKIIISLGHSTANLAQGEKAVKHGANFITHLFNAMLPFHHRDPGLVGLLASNKIPKDTTIYFGIISDGIHTHPAALRIAYRVHPSGLVLVTDAISAMGLSDGKHTIGQMNIEIRDNTAYIAGTNTLCGSTATMIQCVQHFREATGCSREYALEAASLHPALALGISDKKGTLNFGADADFIILDDALILQSTYIAGERVYSNK